MPTFKRNRDNSRRTREISHSSKQRPDFLNEKSQNRKIDRERSNTREDRTRSNRSKSPNIVCPKC